MFSFFQKKTPLTSLFPKNFVDIHSHFLPNIDDGAKSMDESVALLRRMQGYGIKNIICTPHVMESVWENSSEAIQQKLDALIVHLKSIAFTDITISAAAEYMLDANFDRLLKTEKLRTLKDNYILVELSFISPPVNLFETLFNIQIAGYKPVLAHPERYAYYHNDFSAYKKLKAAGCLFQLNLLSLSNYYGSSVTNAAQSLLKQELIDFAGTDTHKHHHLDFLEKIVDGKVLNLIAPVLKANAFFGE
ncbi:MAG: CpsB/CapC family capsule biosynthesis tyrosine phosphatase [Lutibacter sp.]|nr:histidinol phosphatase [Lutibacter sp.]MDT8416165.1 CpsB/CapC family capsule biosynthesis tyrosine phosphatase [Lutibacter sp.]